MSAATIVVDVSNCASILQEIIAALVCQATLYRMTENLAKVVSRSLYYTQPWSIPVGR